MKQSAWVHAYYYAMLPASSPIANLLIEVSAYNTQTTTNRFFTSTGQHSTPRYAVNHIYTILENSCIKVEKITHTHVHLYNLHAYTRTHTCTHMHDYPSTTHIQTLHTQNSRPVAGALHAWAWELSDQWVSPCPVVYHFLFFFTQNLARSAQTHTHTHTHTHTYTHKHTHARERGKKKDWQ